MFASSDMLIIFAKVVDVLTINTPNYLEAFLASLDPFSRNIFAVTKVLADSQGNFVLYNLICDHSNLFGYVYGHRLIILKTPYH